MNDERVVLTTEEAIERLPKGKYVHTFRQGMPGVVLGCDHDRKDLIKTMKEYPVEPSGEVATAMNHGMVLKDSNGCLFIETQPQPETIADVLADKER